MTPWDYISSSIQEQENSWRGVEVNQMDRFDSDFVFDMLKLMAEAVVSQPIYVIRPGRHWRSLVVNANLSWSSMILSLVLPGRQYVTTTSADRDRVHRWLVSIVGLARDPVWSWTRFSRSSHRSLIREPAGGTAFAQVVFRDRDLRGPRRDAVVRRDRAVGEGRRRSVPAPARTSRIISPAAGRVHDPAHIPKPGTARTSSIGLIGAWVHGCMGATPYPRGRWSVVGGRGPQNRPAGTTMTGQRS